MSMNLGTLRRRLIVIKRKIVIARSPFTGTERDVSNREAEHHPTKLCHGIDSCCTDAVLGRRWAVTPKLTMIAGQQLSIGAAFGVKAPFSISR
jgi:hypothetical protein